MVLKKKVTVDGSDSQHFIDVGSHDAIVKKLEGQVDELEKFKKDHSAELLAVSNEKLALEAEQIIAMDELINVCPHINIGEDGQYPKFDTLITDVVVYIQELKDAVSSLAKIAGKSM